MKLLHLMTIPAGLAAALVSLCINACDKLTTENIVREETQKTSRDSSEDPDVKDYNVKDYNTDEEPGVLNGALPVEQKQDEDASGSADESEEVVYFHGMPIPSALMLDDEFLTWYGPVIQGNSLDDPESSVRTLADYGIDEPDSDASNGTGRQTYPKVTWNRSVVTPTGRYDIRAIQKIVRQNLGDLQRCYEAEVSKNKELSGIATAIWLIDDKGSVTKALIKETTLKNKTVESCVVDTIKQLHFPSPKGDGLVKVELAFNFSIE